LTPDAPVTTLTVVDPVGNGIVVDAVGNRQSEVDQGSILQNFISAENCLDKFSSSNFGLKSSQ
jgi:hypothetical protein